MGYQKEKEPLECPIVEEQQEFLKAKVQLEFRITKEQ